MTMKSWPVIEPDFLAQRSLGQTKAEGIGTGGETLKLIMGGRLLMCIKHDWQKAWRAQLAMGIEAERLS